LCSLNVYYSVPIIILIPIMSQLTPVKLTYPSFPRHLNIIFLSSHFLPNGPFSTGVLNPTFIYHLYHVCYMFYPSCSTSFDFSNKMWQVLQMSELSTVQLFQSTCDPPPPPLYVQRFFSARCTHAHMAMCHFLIVRDQVA
jgi:hypothetical protein